MNSVFRECKYLSGGSNIFLEHTGAPRNAGAYYHDYYLIAYIAYGRGSHKLANYEEEISEGDVIIAAPNTSHCFRSCTELKYMEMYYCYFYPQALGKVKENICRDFKTRISALKDNGYLKVKDNSSKELRNIFIRMIDEFTDKPCGYEDIIQSSLIILLIKLFRFCGRDREEEPFCGNVIVDEVIRYINQNIYRSVKLSELAKSKHLTPEYLCRLFKKHTGMTTTQYINNLKAEKAKDMLRNTDRSIARIAETLGVSARHMKTIFMKKTGMSMSEYRKNNYYKS